MRSSTVSPATSCHGVRALAEATGMKGEAAAHRVASSPTLCGSCAGSRRGPRRACGDLRAGGGRCSHLTHRPQVQAAVVRSASFSQQPALPCSAGTCSPPGLAPCSTRASPTRRRRRLGGGVDGGSRPRSASPPVCAGSPRMASMPELARTPNFRAALGWKGCSSDKRGLRRKEGIGPLTECRARSEMEVSS